MTTKHDRFPQRIPINTAQTGKSVRADTLAKIVSSQNYLRNFFGQGLVFTSEPQPPDTTLNPAATSAAPLHYYPILHASDKTDSSNRQLGGLMMFWNLSGADGLEVDWYKAYVPGTPGAATNLASRPVLPFTPTAATYGDTAVEAPLHLYKDFDYDPSASAWQETVTH